MHRFSRARKWSTSGVAIKRTEKVSTRFIRRVRIGVTALVFTLETGNLCRAQTIIERPDLGTIFEKYQVFGTFVLKDIQTGRVVVFDRRRSERRYAPASTFKILNSLIALETGAARDDNEILPYGGRPQLFKIWERDMNMREAVQASSIPIYQELARRVGLERYQEWLRRMHYGNGQTGIALETFWLDGTLLISAAEQAEFVALLARGKLPFSSRSLAIVRDLLLLEQGSRHTLYAKTGWVMSGTPQIGWCVGWVERERRICAFALNIDVTSARDAQMRIPVAKALLSKLDAL